MVSRRLKRSSCSVSLILVLLVVFVRGNEECPVSVDIPGSTTCLRPENFTQNPREIPFRDLGAGGVSVFASGAQVIVPSYTFQCCGIVTLWRTFMQPGGREDGKYDITFQVWRPSDTVQSTGCYSLVGENNFQGIDLGSGGLVCEAPPAGSEIRVQPGDVVGFHSTHADGGDRGVQLDDSVTSERVWYALDIQRSSDSQCVHSVGSGRTLQTFTNHAPILSVTLDAEECPQGSTSSSPPLPTTTELPPDDASEVPLPTTTKPPPDASEALLPITTDPASDLASEAITIPTKETKHSKVETTQDETMFLEAVTTTTWSRVPSQVEPTTERIIGIALGGLGALVLLTAITVVLIVIFVRHCKRRKKKPEGKTIHTLIDASLSYNNVYVQGKIVLLSEYLNPGRLSADLDYDIPQSLNASSSLTESARDMTAVCTTTHNYDQPVKHAPYQQPSETRYKNPRTLDHYDRLRKPEGLHETLVVPYAIGSTSLRSIQSSGNKFGYITDSNDYTARDTSFNIVSNVSYATSEQQVTN